MKLLRIVLIWTLASGLVGLGLPVLTSGIGFNAVWADNEDDDDDDYGGGDDDDDDGFRGRDDDDHDDDVDDDDGGLSGGKRDAGPVARPAPPPPVSAPDEIVALALTETDLAALTAQGFEIVAEIAVPGLAATSRRLRVPPGATLADARDAVRALPSGQDADFNHYYRAEQGFPESCVGNECPARIAIDWPTVADRQGACGGSVTIGMIDTGINETHETFAGARLEVRRLGRDDLDPSRAIHGTAVAALLVGDPATRSPGLVPGARVMAIDAFHRAGSDERVDVFSLIEALGTLTEEDVEVINLSLAGPENTVLAEVVDRLVFEEDIVVVSAVGNLGPNAEPAHPAALDPVIAVTAVDRDGNIYRRAVRGAHVDLAAPGVDVWTAASVSGARWKTGTSFAVPFVTAAAAMLRESRPDLEAARVGEELRRLARDIGDPGPDPVFGAGLLDVAGLCGERR